MAALTGLHDISPFLLAPEAQVYVTDGGRLRGHVCWDVISSLPCPPLSKFFVLLYFSQSWVSFHLALHVGFDEGCGSITSRSKL